MITMQEICTAPKFKFVMGWWYDKNDTGAWYCCPVMFDGNQWVDDYGNERCPVLYEG